MADKYDEAIKYLTDHPDEIYEAWLENYPRPEHPAHCLFTRVQPDDHRGVCGCLTQIRNGHTASTLKLTRAIAADRRIPKHPAGVTVANLPVFAEWQRRIDRELGRQ